RGDGAAFRVTIRRRLRGSRTCITGQQRERQRHRYGTDHHAHGSLLGCTIGRRYDERRPVGRLSFGAGAATGSEAEPDADLVTALRAADDRGRLAEVRVLLGRIEVLEILVALFIEEVERLQGDAHRVRAHDVEVFVEAEIDRGPGRALARPRDVAAGAEALRKVVDAELVARAVLQDRAHAHVPGNADRAAGDDVVIRGAGGAVARPVGDLRQVEAEQVAADLLGVRPGVGDVESVVARVRPVEGDVDRVVPRLHVVGRDQDVAVGGIELRAAEAGAPEIAEAVLAADVGV